MKTDKSTKGGSSLQSQGATNKHSSVWSLLNISLILILILALLLLELQKQTTNAEILKLGIEIYGACVATFLGVYISLSYSRKQEADKKEEDRRKVYLGALKLLASELSLNEQPLKTLSEAISNLPPEPSKYYNNYGFLLEMTRDIKYDVFYSVIASGSMDEVSKTETIFNKVQQAYFNTIKAINGISLSREVLKDYLEVSRTPAFPVWLERITGMIEQETDKIKRAQQMVTSAKEEIIAELKKYDVSFIDVPPKKT